MAKKIRKQEQACRIAAAPKILSVQIVAPMTKRRRVVFLVNVKRKTIGNKKMVEFEHSRFFGNFYDDDKFFENRKLEPDEIAYVQDMMKRKAVRVHPVNWKPTKSEMDSIYNIGLIE